LSRRGHSVEVWTVDRGERPAESTDHAFPVRYLPTPLPARRVRTLLRHACVALPARRRWRAAVREFQPDVLVVQCFGPNGVYALREHRRTAVPLVVVSHGETVGDDTSVFDRSRLLRAALRDALVAASAHAAPSRYVLDDLTARFGAGAGTVIPNGVAPAPEAPAPVRDERLLVAVGRLGRMKGFDLLIDAVAPLEQVRLEIVGDGPERAALQRRIEAAGLGHRVHLLGARDARGVAERIATAAAVVVPSRSEAFGIVALEAGRGGAALVMTTRGGAAEFVSDGIDGLLVDPLDVDALSSAIAAIMADPALRSRLAEAGTRRVAAFSWPHVALQYEMMLDAVVHGPRARR